MNSEPGQFTLYQLAEKRTVEDMGSEFILAGSIGFCKEWGRRLEAEGTVGAKTDKSVHTCLAEWE